jgi:GNAT superfamily N-acetyltransferase
MGIFRPRISLWLLAILGVAPDRQHQGLGRAVVAPGLAAADREHLPAYLETQDPSNLSFYESLGFTTIAELELPHNGPMHYALYRPPRLSYGVWTYGVVVVTARKPRRCRIGELSSDASTWRYL